MHNNTIIPDEEACYNFVDLNTLQPDSIQKILEEIKDGKPQVLTVGSEPKAVVIGINAYTSMLARLEYFLRREPRKRKQKILYPKKQ